MTTSTRAGRLLAALLPLSAAALAACSHGSATTAAIQPVVGSSTQTAVATSTAPTDTRAESARVRAIATMHALRSYAFGAVTQVGPDRTTVTGRAQLPSTVAYEVAKGAARQQVVRVAGQTYVRSLPGTWKRLVKPARAASPLAGLVSALGAASGLVLDHNGTRLRGTMTEAQAAASHLVAGAALAQPVSVTFLLDGTGRVTSFVMATAIRTAGRTVPVVERSQYGRFDTAPPIAAP